MIYILLTISILFANTTIKSYASVFMHTKNCHSPSTYEIYTSAQNYLYNKHYDKALKNLLILKKHQLPYPYDQHIHLYLIYTYYKLNDLQSANKFVKKFINKYPNYKNLDYVLYMYGIINMQLDANYTKLTKIFKIKLHNHNPIYAQIAYNNFAKIIYEYPNSQYCLDSQKRLIFLKNRIAEHELSIIKFYYVKNSYISVINRTEKMLRYFSDTQATRKALNYLQHSYININLYDQAEIVKNIIIANPINQKK